MKRAHNQSLGRHWVGGEWISSGQKVDSFNPATGRIIGSFYDDSTIAHDAVVAARTAFDTTLWSRDRQLRAAVLRELATCVASKKDALIDMLCRENGKLRFEAEFEVNLTITKIQYYAGLALADYGASGEANPGMYSMTLPEAVGVAGIIVPWNAPIILSIRSLAPALAAGCTAVVKVAHETALSSQVLTECYASIADLPAGVVNVFTETQSEGAKFLVGSPEVDVVSYTGSTKVGRQIMAAGAKTLKRLNLELGGKSPCIIFDDADLAEAVPAVVQAGTLFGGQFCMQGSRILVQRSVYEQAKSALILALANLVVGPESNPESQMGPLIDNESVRRVEAFVETHGAEHGTVLVNGKKCVGDLEVGAFIRPSLIEVSGTDNPLVQEEIFGPVLTLEIFETEEEAVTMANATQYGLSASLWTQDAGRKYRVAREVKAGTVWLNMHSLILDQFEEGGYKSSGVGRLNGRRGMQAFQEIKHILHGAGVVGG